ncbi:MAG: DMT family transporter [Xanthomonadaceae bacterium]|nr:DMT family transporter [Xanthomonadaceae bacterium]
MPYMLLGAAMISFAGVFVKLVEVGPTATAFYRMLFGGLVLAVLLLARGERVRPGGRALAFMALAGLLFALDLFFYHRSILYIGPGLATLIANFQVFILALVGVLLLGERLRWQTALSILLAVFGLATIVGFDWLSLEPRYRTGIALGLVTACCYAAYILAVRGSRGRGAVPSLIGNMAVISLCCAALLAVAVVVEGASFRIPTVRDGALLLGYGVVCQALGWLLISRGINTVPAYVVGLVLLLQPTLAFLWDVLFFARRFTIAEAVGAAIVLAAIYLGVRRPVVNSKAT